MDFLCLLHLRAGGVGMDWFPAGARIQRVRPGLSAEAISAAREGEFGGTRSSLSQECAHSGRRGGRDEEAERAFPSGEQKTPRGNSFQ
jgi:hypothetical protein